MRIPDRTPTLSVCLTCRDGREQSESDTRAGTRLAETMLSRLTLEIRQMVDLRGVRCMSQCKRACVASLGAPGCFSYTFGDLDPSSETQIEALLELPTLFAAAPEGFLQRHERPEPLQARIIGRLPPLDTQSALVTSLYKHSAQ